MTSTEKRRRNREEKHRQIPFGTQAYLERCPKCEAGPGDRCRKMYAGKPQILPAPHAERVELLKRLGLA